MWVKLENDTYFDTEHSCILGAAGSGDSGYCVHLVTPHTGGTGRKIRSGFKSAEDAQDALDDFMTEVGYVEIPMPEYDDDEEVDETDYDELEAADLRAEIDRRNSERVAADPDAQQMATTGNKKTLIARLREDDEARTASE